MSSHLVVDERSKTVEVMVAEMAVGRPLDDRWLWEFKRLISRSRPLDRQLAARMFDANRRLLPRDAQWIEAYVDVMTGFFLTSTATGFALSVNKEAMFLNWLGQGNSIANKAERRLAMRLLLKTEEGAERLEHRVLAALTTNLLHEAERWLEDGKRKAGVIDPLDLYLIRRLTSRCRKTGPSPAMLTFLDALDHQAKEIIDLDGWRQLQRKIAKASHGPNP